MLQKNIVLELTEQQTALNINNLVSRFVNLRKEGFGIALDDFGESFANLNMLCRLKPDIIKIAGYFCKDFSTDPYKKTIVAAIVNMAKALNISTVIENIETKNEARTAKELGVCYGQGYYFCKPVESSYFKNMRVDK